MATVLAKDPLSPSRPYNDYASYLRNLFGCRVQKISLDAGLTCPNRDGTKGQEGCIYCDALGSGNGAFNRGLSIREQLLRGKGFYFNRVQARKFIAYFQSFSNTYAPLEKLKGLYAEALSDADVVGLAVGTRPDCVGPEILDLLAGYQKDYLVWVEYGLQSFQAATLDRLNRGHGLEDFIRAVEETRKRALNICVHVIIGLPGEGLEEVMQTAEKLSHLDIQGLKIHSLYISRGTPLEAWYREGRFQPIRQEDFVAWTCRFLQQCPPHWVIQRLTGDPDPTSLVAPAWAVQKQETIKMIRDCFLKTGTFQGSNR